MCPFLKRTKQTNGFTIWSFLIIYSDIFQSCLIFEDESVSVQAGDFGTAAFQYNAEIGRVVVAYTYGVFTDLRFVAT